MLNAAAATTWISAAAVAVAVLMAADLAPVGRAAPRGSHTPLVNKDIPCAAENLKVRGRTEKKDWQYSINRIYVCKVTGCKGSKLGEWNANH